MEEREAIDRIRQGYELGWNRGDLDAALQLLHPAFVAHDASSPEPIRGREAVRAVLTSVRSAFPDLRREALDWVHQGEKLAVRWQVTGTHRGQFQGLEPTGRAVRVTGLTLYRFQDGLVAEEWVEMDALGLLRQLQQPDPQDPPP